MPWTQQLCVESPVAYTEAPRPHGHHDACAGAAAAAAAAGHWSVSNAAHGAWPPSPAAYGTATASWLQPVTLEHELSAAVACSTPFTGHPTAEDHDDESIPHHDDAAAALNSPLHARYDSHELARNGTVVRTPSRPRLRARSRITHAGADCSPPSKRDLPHDPPRPGSPPPAAVAGDPEHSDTLPAARASPPGTAATPMAGERQHFPIVASVRNRALGLHRTDPLLDDLTSVSEELPASLGHILCRPDPPKAAGPTAAAASPTAPRRPSAFASDSSIWSYCRGVTGIGGAMVPHKAGAAATGGPDQSLLYQHIPAPSPTTAKAAGSTAAAPAPEPPRSAGPIKTETDDVGFKTSFQFVVNESPKDARNTVRKHVMREYRRRERWEQDRRRAAGDPGAGDPTASRTKRRRKGTAAPAAVEAASAPETHAATETDPAKAAVELSSSSSSSSSGPNSPAEGGNNKRRRLTNELQRVASAEEQITMIPDYTAALEELEKNKDLPYMADPYAAVAASDVDPFSRIQVGMGPATRSLLHHFAWVMPSLMDEVVTGTVFHRLGWLYSAVAVHDPEPVHVILGFTLGHIAGLRGVPEPALAIEHKSRAFQQIQKRIQDPQMATSNENIGSVVNVAGWELINCNPGGFALHMDGLYRMIGQRGGLAALAQRPELQTVLIRLDVIRAYIAQSSPRYLTYACLRTLRPLALAVPLGSAPTAGSPLDGSPPPVTVPAHAFCEDVLGLIHALEDVLMLLHTIASMHTGTKFPASVVALVRVSVENLLSPGAARSADGTGLAARRAVRWATLVFLDAAIQQFFDGEAPDAGAKRLSSRFLGHRRPGAESAAMHSWGRSLEMVIHVLLAADRLSLERPWRGWYFADAMTLTMRLSDATWMTVESQLRSYLTERCREADTLVGARSANLWPLRTLVEAMEASWPESAATASPEVALRHSAAQ